MGGSDDLEKGGDSSDTDAPPSLCGLSAQASVVTTTTMQFIAATVLAVCFGLFLESTVVRSILVWLHGFCALMALGFLVFCIARRKFGSVYEVLLHAYLLSLLLMALLSLFAVIWLPLSYVQQPHEWAETLHYIGLFGGSLSMLLFQFFHRNVVEPMLPVMEQQYK